ncbi:hypothetical protein C2G38_2064863 [Gigaspora rosea]|uniref:Secreted protein n=1 Tax=Gigaspora rosea TaxID=44941 RepID=A0A397VV99_9GLOM|nr:hypothetical protein C2G38_2064863 [Gigaspora rosea]
MFAISYVSVFLSIHVAISALCSSVITVENGSIVLVGSVDFKIIRGGRTVDEICLFGAMNLLDRSFQRFFSRSFLYGRTLSITSSPGI